MEDASGSPTKSELALHQTNTSSNEMQGQPNTINPLRSLRTAKRRNIRNRPARPPPGLSPGMVRSMVGFWEEKVEEVKGRPCGCGRANCPVNSVSCEARGRWRSAMGRIAEDINLGRAQHRQRDGSHSRNESVSSDMGSGLGEIMDEVRGMSISWGATESEFSADGTHGSTQLDYLLNSGTPSSLQSINLGQIALGSDMDTIEHSLQSPMSIMAAEELDG